MKTKNSQRIFTETLSRTLLCGAVVAATLMVGDIAQAQTDFTWSGATGTDNAPVDGTWDTSSASWDDATTIWQQGAGNNAIFGGTGTGTTVVTVDSSITANALEFTSSTDTYTLDAASPETITLSDTTVGASGGAIQLGSGVTANIGANLTITLSNSTTDINTTSGTTGGILNVSGTIQATGNNSKATSIDNATVNILSGGLMDFANLQLDLRDTAAGSYATINVEGGTLTTTNAKDLVLRGGAGITSTVTIGLNGTGGVINANGITLGAGNGGTAALYLDGGTTKTTNFIVTAPTVANPVATTSEIFFNGGTLQATAASTAFMTGLTDAYVGGTNGSGGAVIDNGGFVITIGQALLTGNGITGSSAVNNAGSTTDGGLAASGAGTTILSGANTYTGATTVGAGTTLQAGVASVANVSGAFGNNSAVTVASTGILDLNGFDNQIGSLTGAGFVTLGSATLTMGGDNTSPAAYSGVISGTGGVTKIGSGSQTLSGTNTYGGATTVRAGTLFANGSSSATGTGTVMVAANTGANAILGGTGAIVGAVTIGGGTGAGNSILAVGSTNATGTLTLSGGVTFAANTSGSGVPELSFQLNSNTKAIDLFTITGSLALGNNVATLLGTDLNFGAVALNVGDILTLATTTSGITGSFSNAANGSDITINGITYEVSYGSSDALGASHADALALEVMAVPEPSTWVMMFGGLAGLLLIQRRRRSA